MKFSDDVLNLTALVQGKKLKLDEESLGKILDVPTVGVRTVIKQQPSTEFMIDASKVGGTFVAGVRKKFLKSEFQLVLSLSTSLFCPGQKRELLLLVWICM